MIYSPDVQVDNPVSVAGGTISVDNFPATQPVSGNVSVSNLPATQPVSGTVSVGNFPSIQPVSGTVSAVVSGAVSTTPVVSSSANITQVVSNSSSQVLLPANGSRKKVILFFNSGVWFVKLGATASNTSFTYGISSANTTVEVTTWTGPIDAICTTNGKLVNVTELV